MGFENIVVGSGPAGLSCAMALLAQGRSVLMLDGGIELEPERAAKLASLRETEPTMWAGSATRWMREGMAATEEGIPLKLAYGSDFPYRSMPGAAEVEGLGVNTKFSLGKGGLSTVWGAAMLPYAQRDIQEWPVSAAELAPHYRAVLDFMPTAQQADDLASTFPLFAETAAMPLSAQGQALFRSMEGHRADLNGAGVTFGRSRLAVNAQGNYPGLGAPSGCVRCGLCMYGCPYGLIYSTAQTLDVLKAHPLFRYAPHHVVERIEEHASGVRLLCRTSPGNEEVFAGERAFIGAGVLATTALVLRSLAAYGQTVELKESHYFLLPMLRPKGVPNFERRHLHTLSQAFLEIFDAELSPYTIHLQTYTYNDLFEPPIAQKLGPLRHLFPWQAFLSRLFLIQGYLHSDHSSTMNATLHRSGQGDTLRLIPRTRPQTEQLRSKVIAKLTRLGKWTGMYPLLPLLQPGEPGRGFHTGGSFPMQSSPSGFASDTLGRPVGMERVHIVDSSILPSVPATTITYTVMANAHRIGSLVAHGAAK